MGFFLRKSLKVGPIRLNLSKSGVGVSAGVTGFRVGIRPDGRRYVHAGRHGLYYRETLSPPGARTPRSPASPSLSEHPPDVVYETASAGELGYASSDEILALLRKPSEMRRTDLIALYLTMIVFVFSLPLHIWLGIALGTFGFAATAILFVWERQRRYLTLDFVMDNKVIRGYESMVNALNELAHCSAVWLRRSARYTSGHERKLSAGASEIVERDRILIGAASSMPWAKCNFTIPTFTNRGQMYYFLPNGVFVYEGRQIGHVAYTQLQVEAGSHRFIEDHKVPADARVVDHTWRYPNKSGGPDRRFSNNYQIPVCLYGSAEVTSRTGLHWPLETSQVDAASRFASHLRYGAELLASTELQVIPLGSKYFGQPFSEFVTQLASITWELAGRLAIDLRSMAVQFPGKYDELLQRVAGEGHHILLWFLRCASATVATCAVGGLLIGIVSVVYRFFI